MKKFVLGLMMVLGLAGSALASSGGGITWDKAPVNTSDLDSLRKGARLFVNYCLNCHSAAYMRYNRMEELGFSKEQIKDNLLFATDKVGDTMKAAIDPKQAKEWFGANPPDLSVIARSRAVPGMGSGADYLYTYLRTYYRDPTKATGWNNLVFPSVGMPHVLWELQGSREALFETKTDHGHEVQVFKGWKQLTPGSLTPLQYDRAVADLVNFMQWMGEPAQNTRVRVGFGVMLFLLMFTVIAWRLNAAFWKDVK